MTPLQRAVAERMKQASSQGFDETTQRGLVRSSLAKRLEDDMVPMPPRDPDFDREVRKMLDMIDRGEPLEALLLPSALT